MDIFKSLKLPSRDQLADLTEHAVSPELTKDQPSVEGQFSAASKTYWTGALPQAFGGKDAMLKWGNGKTVSDGKFNNIPFQEAYSQVAEA